MPTPIRDTLPKELLDKYNTDEKFREFVDKTEELVKSSSVDELARMKMIALVMLVARKELPRSAVMDATLSGLNFLKATYAIEMTTILLKGMSEHEEEIKKMGEAAFEVFVSIGASLEELHNAARAKIPQLNREFSNIIELIKLPESTSESHRA